jgi:8-hydroxy-5-deazaflavin:NADPH oxidoreductase
METKKAKVAVIGLGKIGQVLATNLTKGNYPIIVATRDTSKANDFSKELGNLASPLEIADAIKTADIVIPTIWFSGIKDFLNQFSNELQGKTIIDVSNPIAPDGKGGFKKIIGENESAGEILTALLPKNAKLVKAFGTLGAASLSNESHRNTEPAVLFYASDNTSVNNQIEELIRYSGFEPFHVGGINQSKQIEVFGELHEFGRLGKTVTLSEAKKLIQ